MKKFDIYELVSAECAADGFRITEKATESHELFFVHGKLETARSTDFSDTTVTVYVDHDGKRGDSSFSVSRGTGADEVRKKLALATERAKLVFNEPYVLPEGGKFEGEIESDFEKRDLRESGKMIADAVFAAPAPEGCTLNALEVFICRDTIRVRNSRGVDKTEKKAHAAIEAIPTYTDADGSVELYEMIRVTDFDREQLTARITEKMNEVRDRVMAVKLEKTGKYDVVLRVNEIRSLLDELTSDISYASVYTQSNLREVGDRLSEGDGCDPLTVTMKARVRGSTLSAYFDEDGTDLSDVTVIDRGTVANNYGSSRFGQYLGVEKPSGVLRCVSAEPGTLTREELDARPHIECASLSGLQVELFADYIGGEIRLAYLCEGGKKTPVTGITFSARLSETLNGLRLADKITVEDEYEGPEYLLVPGAEVF